MGFPHAKLNNRLKANDKKEIKKKNLLPREEETVSRYVSLSKCFVSKVETQSLFE